MHEVGFKPMILALECSKTVCTLDRAASVIGLNKYIITWIYNSYQNKYLTSNLALYLPTYVIKKNS
jgi:hypothetical protein